MLRSIISLSLCVFLRINNFAQESEIIVYLFVYESEQTQSGAGHIAMAFGTDSSKLIYYTKYRKGDGGNRKVPTLTLHQAFMYDHLILGLQTRPPSIVLSLPVHQINMKSIEKASDRWHFKQWSIFKNNCTDAVKKVLRKCNINPGIAFLISTPNELVEDLVESEPDKFRNNEYKVLKGNLCFYLKNERNSVSQVILGKRKQRNRKPKEPCL